jgi:hypothetical protein
MRIAAYKLAFFMGVNSKGCRVDLIAKVKNIVGRY